MADACKVDFDADVARKVKETIKELICRRLELFADAIEARNDILEIDGVSIDGVGCPEISSQSRIKVINHKTEQAVEVEIDTIIKTPLEILIPALITGETQKLYGVTRIVGYYSRIQNWNKSKIGELRDRHRGMYGI